MVISRLSGGLANQIYEYAVGYSLAKELRQEFALDITALIHSPRGYCLDFFDIPDTVKIMSRPQDMECRDQGNPGGISPEILQNAVILVDIITPFGQQVQQMEVQDRYIAYDGLEGKEFGRIRELSATRDIYLCGYFFVKAMYFEKYFEEIKEQFTKPSRKLLEEIPAFWEPLLSFEQKIRDKISVGVHIRRGDMLSSPYAVSMQDDYYRLAVEKCRAAFGKRAYFAVFSDDIAYAKQLLGPAEDICYMSIPGHADTDVLEFLCLSRCKHRILSNSSSYSFWANELGQQKDSCTIYQNKDSARRKEKPLWYLMNLRKTVKYMQEDTQRLLHKGMWGQVSISLEEIEAYTQKCQSDAMQTSVAEETKGCLLKTSPEESDKIDRIGIWKEAFAQRLEEGNLSGAWQCASMLYVPLYQDKDFREKYCFLLEEMGKKYPRIMAEADFEKEALQNTQLRKHFILVPSCPMDPSRFSIGMTELGRALQHLGHSVSLVYTPEDNMEKPYLREGESMVDYRGIDLGIKVYSYETASTDWDGFLHDLCKGIPGIGQEQTILITRKPGTIPVGENETSIFWDFSDPRDPEYLPGNRLTGEERDALYEKAAMILTKDSEVRDRFAEKAVLWSDSDLQQLVWKRPERVSPDELYHLDLWAMDLAQLITERIG